MARYELLAFGIAAENAMNLASEIILMIMRDVIKRSLRYA